MEQHPKTPTSTIFLGLELTLLEDANGRGSLNTGLIMHTLTMLLKILTRFHLSLCSTSMIILLVTPRESGGIDFKESTSLLCLASTG